MVYILIMIIVLKLVIALSSMDKTGLKTWFRNILMKWRKATVPYIFNADYIETRAFYMREFNRAPCITLVNDVDINKAFEYISKGNAGSLKAIYQKSFYNWQTNRQEFEKTVFRFHNSMLIELGQHYVEILFASDNYNIAEKLVEAFTGLKMNAKSEASQINIITFTASGLDLKQLQIKPVDLDIDLYYNDDFKTIDRIIKERLLKENDKGIVLLHGLPGTGKTTYLRHLIAAINKKVLFVSPAVAGNLTNPEFIDLLIDHPNAVLVIEDAENIIMDRKYNNNNSVSNLLNISDGLMSDCLNVQIVCTFNSAIHMVDQALMRTGRLIAKYEFGKLDAAKAQKLSAHLGFDHKIDRPMTLAEITNPDSIQKAEKVQSIGFRRMEEWLEIEN